MIAERPKTLEPIFRLGFTNKLKDFTLKPSEEMEGWVSPTEDNQKWLVPLIQQARFGDQRCDESNLSCKIYDLRLCEGDFDNHNGVYTKDEMTARCHEHVKLFKKISGIKVFQIMINKTTGSYKIRFVYAGTLLRSIDGERRVEIFTSLIRAQLSLKAEDCFELIMRVGLHTRTRILSTQHEFYDETLTRRLYQKQELVEVYEKALTWLQETTEDLSCQLVIKDEKPLFHRSSRPGEGRTTERSVMGSLEHAPDEVYYGAGDRYDQLPYVCQYIARCGHKNNKPAAWRLYQQLDRGSKDMREDPARAERDFYNCLDRTISEPVEFSGEFESGRPDELLWDKGLTFRQVSKRDQLILLSIATEHLKQNFKGRGANLERSLKALRRAFELVYSKLRYEQSCPTIDRLAHLDGSVTLDFGNNEKELPEFKWVNTKQVFDAVKFACLTCVVNPNTGREYNYLRERHARCYLMYGNVEQCLKRYLRLPGKDLTILQFSSLQDFTLLIDNKIVTPQNVAEQQLTLAGMSADYRSLVMDESVEVAKLLSNYTNTVRAAGNLLKQESFKLKDRLIETREVLAIVKSAPYRVRYKLIRAYRYGGTLEEIVSMKNRLLGYSNNGDQSES